MLGEDIHYKVVFDMTQKGFDWLFPAAGVLFVLLGLIFVWTGRRYSWTGIRRNGYIFTGFASLWTLIVFGTTLREYVMLHQAYENGRYSVVEGRVHNFRPMPYEGHQEECFSVQDTTFCYSDFERTAGFNNTASHGGPIRPGLPVRVTYVDDHILRIEVKGD